MLGDMSSSSRRLIYVVLALGSFYLALLAFVNLWIALVGYCCDVPERMLRIVFSIAGFIGLNAGWTTIASFPVPERRMQVLLSAGIALGVIGLIGVLILEGVVLPQTLDWAGALAALAILGPLVVAIALLVELWLPNRSVGTRADGA